MASYDVNTYDNVLSNISKEALIAIVIIILAVIIFFIIVGWKTYKKMGEPGWVSLVPIYKTVVLLKKIKLSLIYFLLLMIPVVNFFAFIKVVHSLSKAFGKGVKYTIFTLIFPYLSLPILAFGNSSYIYENEKKEEEAPVENIDTEYVYCPKCNTRLAQNADSCFICGYKVKSENNVNNKVENTVSTTNDIQNNNINAGNQSPVVTLGENSSTVDSTTVNNNEVITNNINESTTNNSIFESNQEIIKNYNIADDNNVVSTPVVEEAVATDVAAPIDNNLYQNVTNDVNNNINDNIVNNNQTDFMNTNLDLNIQDSFANNNAPSIEEMFNFEYNNVTEANNLINNINNTQDINSSNINTKYNNSIATNQFVNNNQNIEYNNSINDNQIVNNNISSVVSNNAVNNFNDTNNVNNINVNNTIGGNNTDFINHGYVDNNLNIINDVTSNRTDVNYNTSANNDSMGLEEVNQNTEILDLNFQEVINSEKQNTEPLNFSDNNIKINDINKEYKTTKNIVNNNINDQNNNTLNQDNSLNIENNNVTNVVNKQIGTILNTNQSDQNNNMINNNEMHVSPIKKPDGYRVCPICGSKVLPNATNCVICGSKV